MMIGSANNYSRHSPCAAVPTSGCSRQALTRELGGSLSNLMALLPPDRRLLPLEVLGSKEGAPSDDPTHFGTQQTPNSRSLAHSPSASGSRLAEAGPNGSPVAEAYPTDSKERERDRKNQMKAEGVEITVKKKVKV